MPPIRKGDGTPVTPKGISQIRTGDGRILFDGPAIPDSVILQPESNDLDSANGDTSDYEINSDPPQYKTDNKIESTVGDANTRVFWPEGTLNNDPQQGFELSAIMTTAESSEGDTADPTYLFGVQDNNNFYAVGLFTGGGDVELAVYKDGLTSDDIVSRTTVPVDFNDGYEYTAEWESNEITARIYEIDQNTGERLSDDDIGSTSFSDSDYSSGGAGFGRSSSRDELCALEHYVNRQPLE